MFHKLTTLSSSGRDTQFRINQPTSQSTSKYIATEHKRIVLWAWCKSDQCIKLLSLNDQRIVQRPIICQRNTDYDNYTAVQWLQIWKQNSHDILYIIVTTDFLAKSCTCTGQRFSTEAGFETMDTVLTLQNSAQQARKYQYMSAMNSRIIKTPKDLPKTCTKGSLVFFVLQTVVRNRNI